MLATLVFDFPYAHVRALALALAVVALIVGAMAMAVAVTPIIVGYCAALLPAVGQTLVMAVVVAGYAWLTKPQGGAK